MSGGRRAGASEQDFSAAEAGLANPKAVSGSAHSVSGVAAAEDALPNPNDVAQSVALHLLGPDKALGASKDKDKDSAAEAGLANPKAVSGSAHSVSGVAAAEDALPNP